MKNFKNNILKAVFIASLAIVPFLPINNVAASTATDQSLVAERGGGWGGRSGAGNGWSSKSSRGDFDRGNYNRGYDRNYGGGYDRNNWGGYRGGYGVGVGLGGVGTGVYLNGTPNVQVYPYYDQNQYDQYDQYQYYNGGY